MDYSMSDYAATNSCHIHSNIVYCDYGVIVMLSSIPDTSSPLDQVLNCWNQLYQVMFY